MYRRWIAFGKSSRFFWVAYNARQLRPERKRALPLGLLLRYNLVQSATVQVSEQDIKDLLRNLTRSRSTWTMRPPGRHCSKVLRRRVGTPQPLQ